MKRLICFLIILISCCLTSLYIGYHFGFMVGGKRVTTTRAVTLTGDLFVLQKLRTGDFSNATSELEYACFVNSVDVLSDAGWRIPSRRKVVVPLLKAYRQTYRTNQTDWKPVERELEALLKQEP
ncbi:MAG: hypothetical protein HOP33_02065 [Verrucomicrobia bacterium]|nr:hypothetical protein [Verrucomicrobiota bacterium]